MNAPYRYITFFFIVIGTLFFNSCASKTKTIYNWGTYEDSIYKMYVSPGKTSVPDEILHLETEIEKTVSKGKSVPPGLNAHLAYLYVTQGNVNAALSHLETEKALFPESTVFVDGLIKRMKKE